MAEDFKVNDLIALFWIYADFVARVNNLPLKVTKKLIGKYKSSMDPESIESFSKTLTGHSRIDTHIARVFRDGPHMEEDMIRHAIHIVLNLDWRIKRNPGSSLLHDNVLDQKDIERKEKKKAQVFPEDPVTDVRPFEIGSDCELKKTAKGLKPHKNKKRAAPSNVIKEQEEEFIDTTQK